MFRFRARLALLAACGLAPAAAPATASAQGADPTTSPTARAVTAAAAPRDALPTIFYVGDSTVRNGNGTGANDLWGWGDFTAPFFDTTRVHLANRALGGRSTRTFISQGHWDRVLAELRRGDVVILQFGHNDASPVNDTSRARGTLHGTGDDSTAIVNLLTHQPEVVHSYGWYLRRLVADVRARGATPIIASPVPRNAFANGRIVRDSAAHAGWAGWARQVARAESVPFLDLHELVARQYDALGPERVKALFPRDDTHTNAEGARLTARVVADALAALPRNPVAAYLAPAARSAP